MDRSTTEELMARADALHTTIGAAHRDLLAVIAELDRRDRWAGDDWPDGDGAMDTAHWLWMRYGISDWKARRWISSAHALERLPRTAEALARGELGIDKVVELTRFATPRDEAGLTVWAQSVPSGAIRRRADVAQRQEIATVRDAEESRTLSWSYFDEGKRFALEAELPAADGAVVAAALSRVAGSLPALPGEEDPACVDARRAGGDRSPSPVRRQSRGRVGGRVGTDGRPGPSVSCALGGHGPSAAVPRSRVHLSRMRHPPVREGSPHRVVGTRRAHGPGQPGPRVFLPPQAGA
jgi:hypothetical protein